MVAVAFGFYPLFDGFTVIPVQLFFAERSIKINRNSRAIVFIDCILMYVLYPYHLLQLADKDEASLLLLQL
jgi:hypothetical protein